MDDSALIRRAVRPLFDSHPNFEVCGEAVHGREAVETAPHLQPDLIVLDLSMPVMTGLEAAPLLLKILPNVWLILFTVHDLPEVYSGCRLRLEYTLSSERAMGHTT